MADELLRKWRLRDPCGTYYLARILASLEHSGALPMLEHAVDTGFHCYTFFARDPWLDPVRTDSAFRAILQRAEAGELKGPDGFDSQIWFARLRELLLLGYGSDPRGMAEMGFPGPSYKPGYLWLNFAGPSARAKRKPGYRSF